MYHPSAPQRERLAALQRLVRDKIAEGAKPHEVTRRANRIFAGKHGVTPSTLKRGLAHCGVNVKDDADVQALFDQFDKEQCGAVSVHAFVKRSQPRDYVGAPWNVKRDKEIEFEARAKVGSYTPTLSAMPPSLAGVKWTTDKILRKLQQKVDQRLSSTQSQAAAGYALFGSPPTGVTPPLLRSSLGKLGIVVDDAQLAELFRTLDHDGSGVITFADLVSGVFAPTDAAAPSLPVDRPVRKVTVKHDATLPPSLKEMRKDKGLSWVEDQIRDKILAKSAGTQSTLFRLFGTGRVIDRRTFVQACHRLGVTATDSELSRLFARYDSDGNKVLDFNEFCLLLTPPDYTAPLWQIERDAELEATQLRKKMDGYEPVPDALPASLKRVAPMTISQVEEAIALRVDQRARDPAAQYREAYRLFGSPSDGITPAAFKYQLGKMGFIIAESELQRMFKLYDANDDGKISFQELASRLFSQTKKTQELWTAHRESDMAKRRAQLRDQLLKDAPHMQPRFRPPPGRSAPILSARTSQLSTGRSASTGAWSSTGRSSTGRSSTGRSSHLSTTRSTSSLRSAGARTMTSSRSHSAIRTGPALGLVGTPAISTRSSAASGTVPSVRLF